MPQILANDIKLYYERRGEGQSVLFISGSGGDLRRKPNQFDSPLGSHFDLIAYDQRGLGQSDNPSADFTMAQYADDAAALLDALDVPVVPVMGVSFGGMVAQELALRHPARVSKLVLACTSAGGAGGASFPLHDLLGLAPRARAEQHLMAADLRNTPEWIAQHPAAWERKVEISLASQPGAAAAAGAEKQILARKNHDTYARLPDIDMPVLLAGGVHDGVAPAENMRAIQQQVNGSELRLYEGGHMFLVQDKSAYPDIVHWLKNTES